MDLLPILLAQTADPAQPETTTAIGALLAAPVGRVLAAIVLGAVGLWCMLPGGVGRWWIFAPFARLLGVPGADENPFEQDERRQGGLFGLASWIVYQLTTLYGLGVVMALASLALLLSVLPTPVGSQIAILFWTLAGLTIFAAVATITVQSPVYCAIWFGLTLVGTAALFFYQGAQFLGVATVVVYAGAILVTFLFVLMLAQPEGHAYYDRLNWGWGPAAFATFAGVALTAIVIYQFAGFDVLAAAPPVATGGVLHPQHVAHLGADLFTRYLIPLEVAGTLLLVALVGAVAIAIHGKDPHLELEDPAGE